MQGKKEDMGFKCGHLKSTFQQLLKEKLLKCRYAAAVGTNNARICTDNGNNYIFLHNKVHYLYDMGISSYNINSPLKGSVISTSIKMKKNRYFY